MRAYVLAPDLGELLGMPGFGLTDPIYVPYIDQALRGAVDAPRELMYVPVTGNPDYCMLLYDMKKYPGGERCEPFGLRVLDKEFGDYRPRATG